MQNRKAECEDRKARTDAIRLFELKLFRAKPDFLLDPLRLGGFAREL